MLTAILTRYTSTAFVCNILHGWKEYLFSSCVLSLISDCDLIWAVDNWTDILDGHTGVKFLIMLFKGNKKLLTAEKW